MATSAEDQKMLAFIAQYLPETEVTEGRSSSRAFIIHLPQPAQETKGLNPLREALNDASSPKPRCPKCSLTRTRFRFFNNLSSRTLQARFLCDHCSTPPKSLFHFTLGGRLNVKCMQKKTNEHSVSDGDAPAPYKKRKERPGHESRARGGTHSSRVSERDEEESHLPRPSSFSKRVCSTISPRPQSQAQVYNNASPLGQYTPAPLLGFSPSDSGHYTPPPVLGFSPSDLGFQLERPVEISDSMGVYASPHWDLAGSYGLSSSSVSGCEMAYLPEKNGSGYPCPHAESTAQSDLGFSAASDLGFASDHLESCNSLPFGYCGFAPHTDFGWLSPSVSGIFSPQNNASVISLCPAAETNPESQSQSQSCAGQNDANIEQGDPFHDVEYADFFLSWLSNILFSDESITLEDVAQ